MKDMLNQYLAPPVLLAAFPRLEGALCIDRVFYYARRDAFFRPGVRIKGKCKRPAIENGRKTAARYRFDFGGKAFVEWEKRLGGRLAEQAFCKEDQSYCVKSYRTSVFVYKTDYYTNSHQWMRTEFFQSPGEKELLAVFARDFLTGCVTLRQDGKESPLVFIEGLDFQNGALLRHVQKQAGLPEAVLFTHESAAGYCREQELDGFLRSIASFYGKSLPEKPVEAPSEPLAGPLNEPPAYIENAPGLEVPHQPVLAPVVSAAGLKPPSLSTAAVLRQARVALQRARRAKK